MEYTMIKHYKKYNNTNCFVILKTQLIDWLNVRGGTVDAHVHISVCVSVYVPWKDTHLLSWTNYLKHLVFPLETLFALWHFTQ